jgi:cytochrome b involved in lipid metabolism
MNSKGIILVASVILVLILLPFSIFFLSSGVSSQNTSNSSSSKSVSTSSVSTNGKLTASEIAKHNTETDCYMIVNGKVYDVTTYLPVHPGGASRIIQYCGKDGTQAFDTKGGQGQHSNRANNDLSSLYKGDLVN